MFFDLRADCGNVRIQLFQLILFVVLLLFLGLQESFLFHKLLLVLLDKVHKGTMVIV